AWQVMTLPDAPPDVRVTGTERTQHGALKISYEAKDDYGVVKMTGTVTPPDGNKDEEAIVFDMTPPASGKGEGSFTVDLSASPHAGEKARLTLTATDGAGHAVADAPFDFILPARSFFNPLARLLVEERRKLMAEQDANGRKAIADTIAAAGGNLAA